MTALYDPAPVLDRLTEVTGKHPKGPGPQYSARCPAHRDQHESLSFRAEPDRGLISCHKGCGTVDIMGALDLPVAFLFPPRDPNAPQASRGPDDWMPCCTDRDTGKRIPGHRKIAEYIYRDADGNPVLGVARCALKGKGCQGFRQWRPDPTSKSGRRWSITLPDGTKAGDGIPYRLPEALRAIEQGMDVWIVEGEKDADRLAGLGHPATCNAGGGTTSSDGKSKWTEAHAEWLTGADIIVVADRDETGRRWATRVIETLTPLARSIEVVQAAIGKDASDHFDAEGPDVTNWLRANGYVDTHLATGQPITRLAIRHFITVATPVPAPAAVPGCDDCAPAGDK